jgi:hypothetical protein
MDSRQKIIEEAAKMFRTYGIRSVTMDMLAGQLGMSKRTIYEIFSDKNELLDGVLAWMAEKQHRLFADIMQSTENVIEAIFKMLDVMAEHFRNMSPAFVLDIKKYYSDIFMRIRDSGEIPYYGDNTDILLRGIKEGLFRKDIDISITNKCMVEVVRMSNEKDILNDDNFKSEDIIRNFYINYLRGISTQKGLDLINFYEKKRTTSGRGKRNIQK